MLVTKPLLLILGSACWLAATPARSGETKFLNGEDSGTVDAKSGFTKDPWQSLDSPRAYPARRNRLAVGYAFMGHVDVDFSGLGGFTNPREATLNLPDGSQDRLYDDGYVRVDSSGNQGGRTWFWGYEAATQVDGDFLELGIADSPANVSAGDRADGHGFELAFERVLNGFPLGRGERHAWFGLRTTFSHVALRSERRGRLRGDLRRRQDAFALDGVVPPLAPYEGGLEGPGPLLSESPASQSTEIVSGGALVDLDLEAEANLWTWSLGPFLELPLTPRLSLTAATGLSLALIHSDLAVQQWVTLPHAGAQRAQGHGTVTTMRLGAYADLGASWQCTEDVSVFLLGRWQYLRPFDHEENGFQVDYRFDRSLSGVVGLRVQW